MPQYWLDTLQDPRLEPYRHLKHTNVTRWSGRFIAEGRRVVERLLKSDFRVDSVLVSDKRLPDIAGQIPDALDVYVLPQKLAQRLVGYNFHTGILACGIRKPNADLVGVLPKSDRSFTLVVCPRLTDPENLGMLIRLCTGFEVPALLLGPGCADPFSRRVLRVSMGTAFALPIIESRNLTADLQTLRDRWQCELVATVLDDSAVPLPSAARTARSALLFGNEAEGLDGQWIDLCDRRLVIPMPPGTDSLNVANAAAVFLYHFRWMAKLSGE